MTDKIDNIQWIITDKARQDTTRQDDKTGQGKVR